VLIKKIGWIAFFALLIFSFDRSSRTAVGAEAGEEVFLKILDAAYQASCGNIELLKDYYLPDAEIIHDGRQMTLEDTIKELKQSMESLENLNCSYKPKVRASRMEERMAYLVVRESLILEADEMGKRMIQQVCTYVFIKKGTTWRIANDHCSTIPGIET
jgi:hypothetical protein